MYIYTLFKTLLDYNNVPLRGPHRHRQDSLRAHIHIYYIYIYIYICIHIYIYIIYIYVCVCIDMSHAAALRGPHRHRKDSLRAHLHTQYI